MTQVLLVLGVLDQRAVVVDLVRVELEVAVDLQHRARRPGGGDDDFDPPPTSLGHRVDGFHAQPLVAGQKRAVEVEGDQVDPPGAHPLRPAATADRGGGFGRRFTLADRAKAAAAAFAGQVVEIDAFGADGVPPEPTWAGQQAK